MIRREGFSLAYAIWHLPDLPGTCTLSAAQTGGSLPVPDQSRSSETRSGEMTDEQNEIDLSEEQAQLAREIGEELTEAFVAYVQGDIAFEDLTFGVYDALSDLHVIAGGDYELTSDGDDEHDHHHDDDDDENEDDELDDEDEFDDDDDEEEDDFAYDVDEATEEQEELSQEPAS
jgi:hypothetical protein